MKMFSDIIQSQWDKPAFSDFNSTVCYTHKDLFNKIARIHIILEENGIKRGDKVALCDKNSSNWAVTFLGLFTYGAVVVPMLAEFSNEQIEAIVKHSDSKLLFTNKKIYDKLTQLDKEKIVCVQNLRPFISENETGETLLAQSYKKLDAIMAERYPEGVKPEDVKFADEDPEALALLSYTSGSTGNPKGVMIPYRAIWSNNAYALKMFPLNETHNYVSLLPLAHMFGFAFEFIFPFTVGCHIHFLARIPSPQIVLKAFSEIKPYMIISVPLVLEKIIQTRIFPMLRTKKMKTIMLIPGMKKIIYKQIRQKLFNAFGGSFYEMIFGGAGVNQDVDKLLHQMKFPYTIGYGMTECAPIICYSDWQSFKQKSCGRAVDRMEVKILSDNPEKVPGEIVCRGMNVMLGYYKNEDATREAIDSEGWLHTGDLGTIDREGNVYIRGRKKNMLLGANGQNIYPEEVEDKLNALDVVDECVVVQRDQKLVALIYTSDDTLKKQEITRDYLVSHLDEYRKAVNLELPKFAQLSAFEVRDEEFEKTPKRNIKRFMYK